MGNIIIYVAHITIKLVFSFTALLLYQFCEKRLITMICLFLITARIECNHHSIKVKLEGSKKDFTISSTVVPCYDKSIVNRDLCRSLHSPDKSQGPIASRALQKWNGGEEVLYLPTRLVKLHLSVSWQRGFKECND